MHWSRRLRLSSEWGRSSVIRYMQWRTAIQFLYASPSFLFNFAYSPEGLPNFLLLSGQFPRSPKGLAEFSLVSGHIPGSPEGLPNPIWLQCSPKFTKILGFSRSSLKNNTNKSASTDRRQRTTNQITHKLTIFNDQCARLFHRRISMMVV